MIRNELIVRYDQNYTPLKITTHPTYPDNYSNKIQSLWPFKISIFLHQVLLEEAKGIHKWQIMHKLRLYHESFVLCKWR